MWEVKRVPGKECGIRMNARLLKSEMNQLWRGSANRTRGESTKGWGLHWTGRGVTSNAEAASKWCRGHLQQPLPAHSFRSSTGRGQPPHGEGNWLTYMETNYNYKISVLRIMGAILLNTAQTHHRCASKEIFIKLFGGEMQLGVLVCESVVCRRHVTRKQSTSYFQKKPLKF